MAATPGMFSGTGPEQAKLVADYAVFGTLIDRPL